MSRTDFAPLAKEIARANGMGAMTPVIEKELLHYEILAALSEGRFLGRVAFQGGTCLRLCYGAPRYSEDLDFAGGTDFDMKDFEGIKACIEKALHEKYRITVKVKEPGKGEGLVKKWRIRVDTAPERPDVPSQKISLEIASIKAYTSQPTFLQLNYRGLPVSLGDIVLFAESMTEILADKLESFACSSHMRYRDLWDIPWLLRRPEVDLNAACELRKKKAEDYAEQSIYEARAGGLLEIIEPMVNGDDFLAQMRRFLPSETYEMTVARPEFRQLMAGQIREAYEKTLS